MTDKPILFSGPMVRALLDGRKTQTRRVLNPQPYPLEGRPGFWNASGVVGGRICISDRNLLDLHRKPAPGDRLYVREAWRTGLAYEDLSPSDMGGEEPILFEADGTTERWTRGSSEPGRFRQGMHMPRWASRLTLIVTDVRVQRLQEISEADAISEGCYRQDEANPCAKPGIKGFYHTWQALNATRGYGWHDNPWVAAYTFTVHQQNIGAMKEAA